MEEWRDIEGFAGYQVSNTGKVRSCINNRHGVGNEFHELKPVSNKTGHKSVQLGRKHRKSVHRLVASAFIQNPDNYPLVRHLDGKPDNNHIDNLAWGTQKDNMQDCIKHGRLTGDTSAAINSLRKPVVATSKDGSITREFLSVNEAARVLNVWPQHICNVIQGKISQTGGWTFRYSKRGNNNE